MVNDCGDVCNEVICRLTALGFDLGDSEDHEPIFNALDRCVIMRPNTVRRIRHHLKTYLDQLAKSGDDDTRIDDDMGEIQRLLSKIKPGPISSPPANDPAADVLANAAAMGK